MACLLAMTFEQYCAVIETTARVHGYSMFLPSLYEADTRRELHVYDSVPTQGNDEMIARAWARSFMPQGERVFLACRGERGVINVFEFFEGRERRKQRILIDANSNETCG